MKAIDICNRHDIKQKSVVNSALQALIVLVINWIDKRGKVAKILGFICPIVRHLKSNLESELMQLKGQERALKDQGLWTLSEQ